MGLSSTSPTSLWLLGRYGILCGTPSTMSGLLWWAAQISLNSYTSDVCFDCVSSSVLRPGAHFCRFLSDQRQECSREVLICVHARMKETWGFIVIFPVLCMCTTRLDGLWFIGPLPAGLSGDHVLEDRLPHL